MTVFGLSLVGERLERLSGVPNVVPRQMDPGLDVLEKIQVIIFLIRGSNSSQEKAHERFKESLSCAQTTTVSP